MTNVKSVINNTVSISLFNKGLAGKIFDDVKHTGVKVVMKNNTAECVLISPDEYIKMIDQLEDANLLALAEERMEHLNPATLITSDELYKEFGITEEDIENAGEVELE